VLDLAVFRLDVHKLLDVDRELAVCSLGACPTSRSLPAIRLVWISWWPTFGFATMDSCWYGDAQYGINPFPLDYNGSTPFDGTLTYLTMQNGSDVLALPFSFPDPTSSEGYLINWLWVNYQ
jgi:hypothetical protein